MDLNDVKEGLGIYSECSDFLRTLVLHVLEEFIAGHSQLENQTDKLLEADFPVLVFIQPAHNVLQHLGVLAALKQNKESETGKNLFVPLKINC